MLDLSIVNKVAIVTVCYCTIEVRKKSSSIENPFAQVVEFPLPTGVKLERSAGGKASTQKAAEILSQAGGWFFDGGETSCGDLWWFM